MKKILVLLATLLPLSCLPGSQNAGAPPAANAPSDEVFINLLRSIEEERLDRFQAAVDPSSDPPREKLYEDMTAFLAAADDIEFNVSVERRISDRDKTIYIFTWQRKFRNTDSGELTNTQGKSEWTLSRSSGRFLLLQMTGTRVFD